MTAGKINYPSFFSLLDGLFQGTLSPCQSPGEVLLAEGARLPRAVQGLFPAVVVAPASHCATSFLATLPLISWAETQIKKSGNSFIHSFTHSLCHSWFIEKLLSIEDLLISET